MGIRLRAVDLVAVVIICLCIGSDKTAGQGDKCAIPSKPPDPPMVRLGEDSAGLNASVKGYIEIIRGNSNASYITLDGETSIEPREGLMPFLVTLKVKHDCAKLNFIIYRNDTSWSMFVIINDVKYANSNLTEKYIYSLGHSDKLDEQKTFSSYAASDKVSLVLTGLNINPILDTSSWWPTIIIWLLIIIVAGSIGAYYVITRR